MKIGEKIKKLRKKHDITQEQLSEQLGISFQAVSKWENNIALPDIMLIPVLAVFFGVTTDYLFDTADDTAAICDTDEQAKGVEIKVFAPEKFDDSREIGDLLKARKAVVVNLEKTKGTTKRRLLDFMMGMTYMEEYKLKKISDVTYIITPPSVLAAAPNNSTKI